TDWSKVAGLQIPFKDVVEEVDRQFGVALPEVGGRINRYWTLGDVGTNPTAAVVFEHGMFCFSDGQGFTPWSKILGAAFCRKYHAKKIGAAVAGVWFDGSHYWKRNVGRFVRINREEITNDLKVEHKLSARLKSHADTYTEVDEALHFVKNQRRVDGAMPLHYSEEDTHELGGKRYINNSYLRAT